MISGQSCQPCVLNEAFTFEQMWVVQPTATAMQQLAIGLAMTDRFAEPGAFTASDGRRRCTCRALMPLRMAALATPRALLCAAAVSMDEVISFPPMLFWTLT